MATLVFVLAFVLAGLGVLLAALSGGPSGVKLLSDSSSGGRRSMLALFVVTLLVLGAGVPFGVMHSLADRSDVPNSSIELNEREREGRELFGENCSNCHTLKGANAVADVGPSLDQLKPPKKLVLDAIEKGRSQGNGQMAADLVEGEDAEKVAEFVEKVAGKIADQ